MELKLIRKKEDILEFETTGESHTFLNLLRAMLKDQEGVIFSAYRSKHPLLTSPIVYVRTKDIDPIVAVTEASKGIISVCDDFKSEFEKKANAFK